MMSECHLSGYTSTEGIREDNVQEKTKGASAEPETLRIHREMYERRLREMGNCGKAKEEVDAANSPAVLQHRDSAPERDNLTKKAAALKEVAL
jgi:hypothetical protein